MPCTVYPWGDLPNCNWDKGGILDFDEEGGYWIVSNELNIRLHYVNDIKYVVDFMMYLDDFMEMFNQVWERYKEIICLDVVDFVIYKNF